MDHTGHHTVKRTQTLDHTGHQTVKKQDSELDWLADCRLSTRVKLEVRKEIGQCGISFYHKLEAKEQGDPLVR